MKTLHVFLFMILLISKMNATKYYKDERVLEQLVRNKNFFEIYKTMCSIPKYPSLCYDFFPANFEFKDKVDASTEVLYLGAGNFGKVYKKNDNTIIKVIDCNNKKGFNKAEMAATEINLGFIMSQFHNENLASQNGCCVEVKPEDSNVISRIFIEMDLYKYGDLEKFMSNPNNKPIVKNVKWKFNIIRRVFNGLKEMHKNNYAHLDLFPRNIFLEAHGRPRIGDFGISRHAVINPNEPPLPPGFTGNTMNSIYRDYYKRDIKNLGSLFVCVLLSKVHSCDELFVQYKSQQLCHKKQQLNEVDAIEKEFYCTYFEPLLEHLIVEKPNITLAQIEPYLSLNFDEVLTDIYKKLNISLNNAAHKILI